MAESDVGKAVPVGNPSASAKAATLEDSEARRASGGPDGFLDEEKSTACANRQGTPAPRAARAASPKSRQ